jgi:N-acetylmuramoyl-L-alanine amidase
VTWTGGDSAAGSLLEIAGRNVLGRATPRRRTWVPAVSASSIDATVYRVGPDRRPLALHWRTADGLPAPAGTLVAEGRAPIPVTGDRQGWVPLMGGPDPAGGIAFAAADSNASMATAVATNDMDLPADRRWSLLTSESGGLDASAIVLREVSRPRADGRDTEFAPPLIGIEPGRTAWVEAPGFAPVVIAADTGVAAEEGGGSEVRQLAPLFPAMIGRTVVLDPAGGGSDPEGTGPLGTRGADLNLDVARSLARMLRGAGAEVHLTRETGAVPLPEDKIERAGDLGADYFRTIGRAAPGAPATVRHHYGSVTGSRWAGLVAAAFEPLAVTLDSVAVEPSYAYLLRHTACPALEVRWPGPATIEDEVRMTGTDWIRAEAQVHLTALVSLASGEDALVDTVDPAAYLANTPGVMAGEVELAVLDGQFTWAPAARPVFEFTEASVSSWRPPGFPVRPGDHTLEIRTAGSWQLWRITYPLAGHEPEILISGP